MKIKTDETRLTVVMPTMNYKILKKLAVDRNTTLRALIIKAIAEYVVRNGSI